MLKKLKLSYCLDTSHALMCINNGESKLMQNMIRSFDLVSHIHLAGASGVYGEGEGFAELTDDERLQFQHLIGFDTIKVLEVWQGHLNGFHGFNNAVREVYLP